MQQCNEHCNICYRKCNSCNTNNGKRSTLKLKMLEYKGGFCQRCGYSLCVRALGFHHRIAGSKEFTLSAASTRNMAWGKIKRELDKCDLLCANCHHEVHS